MKRSLSNAACILSRMAANNVFVVFEEKRSEGYSRPNLPINPTSLSVCEVDRGSQHVSTCSVN